MGNPKIFIVPHMHQAERKNTLYKTIHTFISMKHTDLSQPTYLSHPARSRELRGVTCAPTPIDHERSCMARRGASKLENESVFTFMHALNKRIEAPIFNFESINCSEGKEQQTNDDNNRNSSCLYSVDRFSLRFRAFFYS